MACLSPKQKILRIDMTKEELLSKKEYGFSDLVEIMKMLRAPDGCPWDREQTHQSIRRDLLEETYELIEGIDKDDAEILREELGDLFHLIVIVMGYERDAYFNLFALLFTKPFL